VDRRYCCIGKLTKFGILTFLIAGLLLLGACIPEAQAVGGDVIIVSAGDLYSAYLKDEAAADARYKGRTLEITGEVLISRAIVVVDQYCIVLDSGLGEGSNTWGVQCFFEDNQDARLYKAEKHRIVTVKGRCDGLQQDVVMRDCEFINLVSPTPTALAAN
jgi:hypothetical protein